MSTVVCTLHHHVGRESVFERGLNVSSDRDVFEAQVDWLQQNFDVIDLDVLLSGKLPKRPLLLTFDDAFRSVLDVAREVLAPRGLPSVYFINPGLLGEEALSLDGALAWASQKAGVEALCDAIGISGRQSLGEVILQDMAKLGASARADIKARVLEAFGPLDLADRSPLLDPAELAEMPGLGMEIGNHTMTHVHCRALSVAEIETEVVQAKAKLKELSRSPVRSFSVPYGHEKDLTPAMLQAVRASGHEAIFLVHARSNWRRPASDVWYRTSLHNEAPKDLMKKLRYLPAARSIKHLVRG